MKGVWILYVTFARDLHWLRYSLESVCKYATGFEGVMVVVPTQDKKLFDQFTRYSRPGCPVVIKDFLEFPGKGFVHHLAMKCYADVLCPQASFILHMDPDCLFSAPVTPDDYLGNTRPWTTGEQVYDIGPVLVIEPYDVLKTKHPARYHWKEVTEAALKFNCTHETMCRHPAVHFARTYIGLRNHMEAVHGIPFIDFVLKQKNAYPQGFGEFNTLGAYALEKMSQSYCWIDRKDQGEAADPPSKLTQMWSYQGVERNMPTINRILNG